MKQLAIALQQCRSFLAIIISMIGNNVKILHLKESSSSFANEAIMAGW